MKTIKLLLLAGLITGVTGSYAQSTGKINFADSTGLPGDHFSLEGALAIFKDSKSLEDFEKRINLKDSAVNNLDLNGDKNVDYIRVVADKKGDAHVVILQVPVSKTESQDVAVIEIEKNGDQSAFLQIIGDEALYGEMRIVEPKSDSEPSDPGVIRKGPAGFSPGYHGIFVNVWFWPCIRLMYAPVYVVYVSPWYWDYYPVWWSPWHPFPWRYHHMHTWHYHHHYHVVYDHRSNFAHQVYAPRRTTSNVVVERYRDARANYKATHQSKPRTGNNINQSRPVKSGVESKPATRPVKPESKPGTVRPQSKPETRPEQPKELTRPQSPPGKEITKPQTKPRSDNPKSNPQVRPQESKPSKGQQVRPQKSGSQSKPQKSNSGSRQKNPR